MNTEKPVTADFASNPMSLSNSKRDITTVASSTKSLLGQKKKEKNHKSWFQTFAHASERN